MNHEEQHLPLSPGEEQDLDYMLMHDEKQEGILRFMTRDKDMDVWGLCMSDVHANRNIELISTSTTTTMMMTTS